MVDMMRVLPAPFHFAICFCPLVFFFFCLEPYNFYFKNQKLLTCNTSIIIFFLSPLYYLDTGKTKTMPPPPLNHDSKSRWLNQEDVNEDTSCLCFAIVNFRFLPLLVTDRCLVLFCAFMRCLQTFSLSPLNRNSIY